jgi:hypothetical protein
MSYRWIMFVAAAAGLGFGAWYFGRPIAPNEKQPERVVEAPPAVAESPKQLPPKVIEVIDLTRAYDPAREPEGVPVGSVDPASFIEEQAAPARIPYAADVDNPNWDLLMQLRQATRSAYSRPSPTTIMKPELIEVMPREVIKHADFTGNVFSWQEPNPTFDQNVLPITEYLNAMPREVPFILGAGINNDAGISASLILIGESPEVQKLTVMPREVK